jgi:hypothetical protein
MHAFAIVAVVFSMDIQMQSSSLLNASGRNVIAASRFAFAQLMPVAAVSLQCWQRLRAYSRPYTDAHAASLRRGAADVQHICLDLESGSRVLILGPDLSLMITCTHLMRLQAFLAVQLALLYSCTLDAATYAFAAHAPICVCSMSMCAWVLASQTGWDSFASWCDQMRFLPP